MVVGEVGPNYSIPNNELSEGAGVCGTIDAKWTFSPTELSIAFFGDVDRLLPTMALSRCCSHYHITVLLTPLLLTIVTLLLTIWSRHQVGHPRQICSEWDEAAVSANGVRRLHGRARFASYNGWLEGKLKWQARTATDQRLGDNSRRSARMKCAFFLAATLLAAVPPGIAAAATTGAPAPTVTIGETAQLTSGVRGAGNLLFAQGATLAQSATIQSMSFSVAVVSGKLVLGIYSANGPSGGPGTLVAQTAAFTPSVGWNVASTTTAPTLPAGNYWLALLPSSSDLTFREEVSTGNCRYYKLTFTSTLPRTFSTNPTNCTPKTFSLYATLKSTTTPPTLKLSDSPSAPTVPANAATGGC
jgi:hypothetical protein